MNKLETLRLMMQSPEEIPAAPEPSIEELSAAVEASYRRRRRKQVVFEVIGWSSLIILFCGTGLALIYALGL